MATPIKSTPILFGSSSKKFNAELVSGREKKASSDERERVKNLVHQVIAKNSAK